MSRFTGRCKGCKGVVSLDLAIEGAPNKARRVTLPNGAREAIVYSDSLGHHFGAACLCGARVLFVRVRGRVTEHTCGAKCRSSRGHVCECSCGGKNHGAGFGGGAE